MGQFKWHKLFRPYAKPVKNAYKLAKKGKIRRKHYLDHLNKPEKELRKAIESMTKQIKKHEYKIANPRAYYGPDWDTFSIIRKTDQKYNWYVELKAFTENRDIYKGILENRKI